MARSWIASRPHDCIYNVAGLIGPQTQKRGKDTPQGPVWKEMP